VQTIGIARTAIAEIIELEVGTITVATGYDIYYPFEDPRYGYGKYANVITALEAERLINAAGRKRTTSAGSARPMVAVGPGRLSARSVLDLNLLAAISLKSSHYSYGEY
jgi:hypothetical protein